MPYKPSAAKQAEAAAKREEVLQGLADGIDKLTSSHEWQRYLDVQSRFRSYSFGNVMLILTQRPDATRVMPFGNKEGTTGWKSVGRWPRKGETGIRIWAPHQRKTGLVDAATGEELKDTGFHLVAVFDIEQTEGEELPEPLKLLDGEAPKGLFAKLTQVAQDCGYTVQTVPAIEGFEDAHGVCRHDKKLIEIATEGRSELQQVKTMSHELGHALLHHPKDQLSRGTKELEAESTAYVVCQSLGLDTSDYSLGYVADWQGGDGEKTREAIKASGGRIHQASKQIMDGLEREAEAQKQIADYEMAS